MPLPVQLDAVGFQRPSVDHDHCAHDNHDDDHHHDDHHHEHHHHDNDHNPATDNHVGRRQLIGSPEMPTP